MSDFILTFFQIPRENDACNEPEGGWKTKAGHESNLTGNVADTAQVDEVPDLTQAQTEPDPTDQNNAPDTERFSNEHSNEGGYRKQKPCFVGFANLFDECFNHWKLYEYLHCCNMAG